MSQVSGIYAQGTPTPYETTEVAKARVSRILRRLVRYYGYDVVLSRIQAHEGDFAVKENVLAMLRATVRA